MSEASEDEIWNEMLAEAEGDPPKNPAGDLAALIARLEFADACSADLCDPCPGFAAIDAAKAEFNKTYTVQ